MRVRKWRLDTAFGDEVPDAVSELCGEREEAASGGGVDGGGVFRRHDGGVVVGAALKVSFWSETSCSNCW